MAQSLHPQHHRGGHGHGLHHHHHHHHHGSRSELARTTRTMEGEAALLRPGQSSSSLRSHIDLPNGRVPLPGMPKIDRSRLIGPGGSRSKQRPPALTANGRKLRSDLLRKLGIDEAASKGKKTEAELRQRSRATADRSLLGDMPAMNERLKYDPDWEEELDAMVSAAAGETDDLLFGLGGGSVSGGMMMAMDGAGVVGTDPRETRSAPGSRASSPPKDANGGAGGSSGGGGPAPGSWQEGLAALFSSLGGSNRSIGSNNGNNISNGNSISNDKSPSAAAASEAAGTDGNSSGDENSVTSVDSQPTTALETTAAVKKHHLGPGRRRKLTFFDNVKVVPIPMRTEYSDRVRERLWSNRIELHENAQRNAVEFASEGWDWRTVTEDEGMYRCAVSGELIHPVHCQTPYQDGVTGGGADFKS